LRLVAAAQRARDRAGGSGASAGSARLAVAALAAALLLAIAPVAWALGKSPPATPSPPAETPPSATSPAKPAAASSAPSKPVPGAIPAPDIPLEADRLMTALRALDTRVVSGSATAAIETALPSMVQRVSDAQLETKGALSVGSSLTVLTNLADLWSGIQADLKTWAEHLRVKATDVGLVLDELADLTDIWTRTREEARRTQAPPALLKRTDEALAAIAAERAVATARRAALLTLQVKVGEQLAAAQAAAEQINRAMTADLSALLRRDQPPIWQSWRERPPLADLPASMRESAVPQLEVMGRFAADRFRATMIHAVLFVVLLVFAHAARRQVRRWEAAGSADSLLRVFELPISTALIVTLLLTDWLYAKPPMIALNLLGLIFIAPVSRIVSVLTKPAPTTAIWTGAALFVANRVRDLLLLTVPPLEQAAVFLITAGSAAALLWLWRRDALVVGSFKVPGPVMVLATAALVAAAALALFGYMQLARLLGGGVLRSAYTALALYAGALVALAVFAYLLRIPPLARLHMVTRYRMLMERRVVTLVFWLVALFWLDTTLQWFSLLDEAKSLGLAVLDFRLTRGFVSISLGDVLALVVTVWLAFLVSRFVRFALEEDVYPRLPMGRGIPYAISSLLHYVILLLGFLLAIGAMGLDLNRFTVLTGAFGVGVGFGLQTIVSNFVSGIILLLERPIQVGDAIQMADLDGEVRRIGLRATTVHTWRGAEVIVPNATLISGNLTNWTLSDRTRRLELPVGVAYGTDPQRVIALLAEVGASVPGVLANPAPMALFQGFGDSSLNFELRAWTDHFEEWAAIRSHIAVAVNNRLKAEGIEIPFPQRDVNLRYPPREET
jgi:small-conductance mechanosensitive channel